MSTSDLEKMPRMLAAWKSHAPVEAIAISRQSRTVLVRSDRRVLEHWSSAGKSIARWTCPEPVVDADVSDDGATIIVATERNVVYWCNALLEPGVCVDAPNGLCGVGVDADGWYAMATSQSGDVVLIERNGRCVVGRAAAQPLHFVAAGLESPNWVGASRMGGVTMYDMEGTALWHRNAMCPVADMSTSASGKMIVLAGLGMGVLRFDASGKELVPWATPEPVARVSLTADGRRTLAVTSSGTIWLLGPPDPPRQVCSMSEPIAGATIAPMGDVAWLVLESGRSAIIDLTDGEPG
jgi:hypothetical protein